jgi:hypothetical protein
MKTMAVILISLAISSCTKLPESGWYKHGTTGEKLFVVMTGKEEDIQERYGSRFTSADFIEAFSKTRSSQFIHEGRPKYFAVISDGPDRTEVLRIMALEILERDYKREKGGG